MKSLPEVSVALMLASIQRGLVGDSILRGLVGGSIARQAVTVPHERETKRVTAADLERINAAIAKRDRKAARRRPR